MRVADGGGTGRLDGAAAAKAAAEAAARAAAEAAQRAAEAARARAAAEAAQRAAEAAAKATAEASQRNTGRLAETAKKMDMGHAPWEAHAEKAAGAVAAVTGGVFYQSAKNAMSAQKKVSDVKETVEKLRGVSAAADDAGKLANVVSKANGAMKVVGGVQSALDLPNAIGNLKDGASKEELITLSKDVLGTVRGADAAVKLAGKGSMLGKFNPVVAVAGAVTDGADRINKLKDWGNLSTKDKISNIAGLGADVADVVGAVTPPPIKFAAMGISAGLSLVSLGAQNFDKVSAAASATVHAVGDAANAVGHEVAEKAHEAVDKVKDIGSKALDVGKKIFHGL